MAILATGVALTSCSSDKSQTPAAEAGKNTVFSTPAPISATPQFRDTKTLTLPVEAYLFSAEQEAQINHAMGIMVTRCMRRLGLNYPAPQVPRPNKQEHTYRRYGVTDERVAATYGYQSPPKSGSYAGVRSPASELERLALAGGWDDAGRQLGAPQPTHIKPSGKVNGHEVPLGGCTGEAERQITGGRSDAGSSLIAQQVDQSYDSSLADSRVRAVFAKWSACMKEKGYTYKTVVDVGNDKRWASDGPVTAREIATARADVECKAKHNVVGVWSAVEAAYQKTAIEKNHERLEREKDSMDAALRKAAEIISAGV